MDTRHLADFTVDKLALNIEALQKIDNNRKGFLIVVHAGRAEGTLTDGDIRRAFIAGRGMRDSIESVYVQDFKYVRADAAFKDVISLFKNEKINFLPIISHNMELVNIVTKKQLHAFLLQDMQHDLRYPFMSLDESLVDQEIFVKPWGFYKTTVRNDYFQSKILTIEPGAALSLQLHKRREEHWIVTHGTGMVQIGESICPALAGNTFFIPKGCMHRIQNTSNCETLIVTEVQLGGYFGEDDIIRLEDHYGRD